MAVLQDDQISFAAHAERYSRRKMDRELCEGLIQDVLEHADRPFSIAYYERQLLKRTREVLAGQYRRAFSTPTVRGYLGRFPSLSNIPINFFDHHYAHACGGYFTSNFRDASIVVIDGIGEWETLTVWRAVDRKIERILALKYPHSIGLFYSAFTDRCGFKPNEEEYIMMGLSAFGEPIYADAIRTDLIADVAPTSMRFRRNLHRGVRDWRPELTDVENIAASCQLVTEQLLAGVFKWVRETLPSRNLVYSGGVALNCMFNGKLAQQSWFDQIWIMPEPGDAGSSLGAALAQRGEWVDWRGPYLGHNIDRELDVEGALAAILRGDVIGIAHGRAEFGPRALGNRSLIADPRGPAVKDKVNQVKKRELFRPFAPIVLRQFAQEYFDLPTSSSPYMQFVVGCNRPQEFPAICHVDGTSRVQTLEQAQNPPLHKLLSRFYAESGCPILLNTSLNLKGEPLVNSWEDAQRFGALNGIDIF